VISIGEPAPDARVWITPNDEVNLSELGEDGPYLLLFYLFDWSST
jgi:peroxiredoxin